MESASGFLAQAAPVYFFVGFIAYLFFAAWRYWRRKGPISGIRFAAMSIVALTTALAWPYYLHKDFSDAP